MFLKKSALALSIMIVLNLFIYYAVSTFCTKPLEEDFCKEAARQSYQDKGSCEKAGFQWRQGYGEGRCDTTSACREAFENATKHYRRNMFIVRIGGGVLALVAGIFITVPGVTGGLIGGVFVSLFIGAVWYWTAMHDYLRVIVLGITLIFEFVMHIPWPPTLMGTWFPALKAIPSL